VSPVFVFNRSMLGWVVTEVVERPTPPQALPPPRAFGELLDLDGGALLVTSKTKSLRAARHRATSAGFEFEDLIGQSGAFIPECARLVGDIVVLGAEGESLQWIDLATAGGSVTVGCAGGVNSGGARFELSLSGAIPGSVVGGNGP